MHVINLDNHHFAYGMVHPVSYYELGRKDVFEVPTVRILDAIVRFDERIPSQLFAGVEQLSLLSFRQADNEFGGLNPKKKAGIRAF